MIKEETRFAPSNVFEGMVSFRALIDGIKKGTTDRKIERVVFDKSRAKKISGHLSYIKAMSYELGFEMCEAEPGEIESVAVGSSHGGIITYASKRMLPELTSDNIDDNGFYVYLDGIEDPYNFGYALRSLYAAGVTAVILGKRNFMSAAGVVCRASAGASEMMHLYESEPDAAASVFGSKNYKIVCADIDDSVSVYDADLKKPLLLAVGGEKRGLSKAFYEHPHITVRLDYGRDFPSALSAASASSILAFEVYRQNR
jgi:23S rRNA (guanosine2251-2'-O)-methyltransferase